MKITAVRGLPLRCTCEPISDALSTSRARQALLVLLDTDTGLQGIGEAFTYGAPLAVMKYLVENTLGPKLIGRDPADIDSIWQILYISTLASGRRSMTLGAISGIDIALWDLKGKCEHKPIAALLGGTRDRIPSYASGGFYAHGKGLDGLRRELEGYMRMGYTDAKIKIGRNLNRPHAPLKVLGITEDTVTVEEDWQRIRAAKEIVGEGNLAVDTNASWDRATALENAPRLVEAGVGWLEEPIPFEDMQGLTLLCRSNPGLKIVGCETQQGAGNFTTMLDVGALDVVQPDVGWAGGISECVRIGAAAQAHGRPISLHCFGSAVLFAASLQVSAALPGLLPMESEENPNPLKSALTKAPFTADEKMAWYVPQGDGLGIDLDWDAVGKFVVK